MGFKEYSHVEEYDEDSIERAKEKKKELIEKFKKKNQAKIQNNKKEEQTDFSLENEKLKKENKRLQRSLKKSNLEISKLQSKSNKNDTEIEYLKKTISTNMTDINKKFFELKNRENEIESVKKRNNELAVSFKEMGFSIEEPYQIIEFINSEKEKLQNERTSMQNDLDLKFLNKTKEYNQRAEKTNLKLTRKIHSMKNHKLELDKENKLLKKKEFVFNNTKAENKTLKKRIFSLENEIKKKNKFPTSFSAINYLMNRFNDYHMNSEEVSYFENLVTKFNSVKEDMASISETEMVYGYLSLSDGVWSFVESSTSQKYSITNEKYFKKTDGYACRCELLSEDTVKINRTYSVHHESYSKEVFAVSKKKKKETVTQEVQPINKYLKSFLKNKTILIVSYKIRTKLIAELQRYAKSVKVYDPGEKHESQIFQAMKGNDHSLVFLDSVPHSVSNQAKKFIDYGHNIHFFFDSSEEEILSVLGNHYKYEE